jgi:hypothetical protein
VVYTSVIGFMETIMGSLLISVPDIAEQDDLKIMTP